MKTFVSFVKVLLISLTCLSSLTAQENGIYLGRTEYTAGDVNQAKKNDGDTMSFDCMTQSMTGVVGFWYKRDLAQDLTSDENPLRSDGADSIAWFTGNAAGMAEARLTRAELAAVNKDDVNWHYIYAKFNAVRSTPPAAGAHTPSITNTVEFYVDDLATPIKTGVSGAAGHYLGFSFGGFVSGIKFATGQNMIIDDLNIWDGNNAEVMAIHKSIGTIGMDGFVPTHFSLHDYMNFDGSNPDLPVIHWSDSTKYQFAGGATVGTAFYNIAVTTPQFVNTAGRRSPNIALNVISQYGSSFVTPNVGTSPALYSPDPTHTVTFKAPEFVYLDRFGVEIGSSDSTSQASFLDKAVVRAKNIGYIVNGQRTDTGGNASRTFTQSRTENLRIEWLWEVEYAVSLDVNDPQLTSTSANLSFTGDGSQQSAGFGKFWVKAGTQVAATLDGIISAGSTGDTRYRLTDLAVENYNTTAGADRYMTFNGTNNFINMAGSAPLPDMTNFTTDFWMRWDGASRTGLERIMSLHTEIGGGNTSNVYTFGITGTDHAVPNTIYFDSQSSGGFTIPAAYLDTAWHHWAFSYDQTAQQMKLYRDGQLIHTQSSFNLNFDANNAGDGSLLIGNHPNLTVPFGGSLNNVRLWTSPLDAAAVGSAMSTADYADTTANLEFEFTFDGDSSTQAVGKGRTTYTGAIANYSNAYFDALTEAQKVNVIYPSIEARNINLGDITQVSSGNLIVDGWIGLRYVYEREYKLALIPSSPTSDANLLASMPYAIVNGADLYSSTEKAAWVPELSQVRVGTRYRFSQSPNCVTLGSIQATQGTLTVLSDESVVDGTSLDSKAGREVTINVLSGPGRAVLNFEKTIHRAEIPLGEFLDVTDLASLNAAIVPDLCPGGALNLVVGPNPALKDFVAVGSTAQLTDTFVWDKVGKRVVPTAPGVMTLEWIDANGVDTHLIQITSEMPTNTITNLPHDRENPINEGYRLGVHPTYDTDTVMGNISDAFPGSPRSNYVSLYNANLNGAAAILPVDLDANSADRWVFKGITYTDSLDVQRTVGASDKEFRASGNGRAVALYQYRPDPNQVATGDITREAMVARVIEAKPHTDFQQADTVLASGERKAFSINETDQYYSTFPGHQVFHKFGGTGTTHHRRAIEFWAQLDASVANTAIDRVVWESIVPTGFATLVFNPDGSFSSVAVNNIFQIGFRGTTHATAPGAFFLESYQSDAPATKRLLVETTNVQIDSAWHHWCVGLSSGESKAQVYLDGNLVANTPFAQIPAVSDFSHSHTVGYSPISSGKWFNGSIDNLAMWDGFPSAADVRAMMRGSRAGTPLTQFKFDTAATGNNIPADAGTGAFYVLKAGAIQADPTVALVVPTEDTFPEVASRILSKYDTSGFGTAYLLNTNSNYNAELYDREGTLGLWGPIFPTNWGGLYSGSNQTELIWYSNPRRVMKPQDTTVNPAAATTLHPNLDLPHMSVQMSSADFPSKGKDKDKRIYIASRLGNEGVDANGNAQLLIDPAQYEDFTIYNQPNPNTAGYNPNEEHALLAPSIKATLANDNAFNLGQDAAFALQKDLNLTNRASTSTYTSDPWTLIQYRDKTSGEWEMAAYQVEKERVVAPEYRFRYNFNAGDIVVQPYPLNRVVGNVIMTDDAGGNIAVNNIAQRTLWFDKNHTGWVVSGNGKFFYQFWYPFTNEFWYDLDKNGSNDIDPGVPLAWVPSNGQFRNTGTTGLPQRVIFDSLWASNYPKLKRGETLTFAGGENKAENPLDAGLPAVVAMASAELIYDTATPTMAYDHSDVVVNGVRINDIYTKSSARITRPLDRQEASLAQANMPTGLTPAATDNVMVVAERWYFKQLTGSLQKRFYYDSLLEKLVFRGRLNDKESGDPELTQQPVSLSIIEPNVLTPDDYQAVRALDTAASWTAAIDAIYLSSQDPHGFTPAAAYPATSTSTPAFFSGIVQPINGAVNVPFYNEAGIQLVSGTGISSAPLNSLGAGSALVPTANLLTQDTTKTIYLTVAENNHANLDAAVSLHIIEVVPDRFRGGIKLVEAQDAFDDKVNLIHTGDFGGDTRDVYYEWWVRDVAALNTVGTPETDAAWQLYTDGLNQRSISFSGRPDITLADKLFFVRYGEKNELGDVTGQTNSITALPNTANTTLASWRLVDINNPSDTWLRADSAITTNSTGGAVPFQWAGAANSPQQQADGSKKYIPQLIMGWVKRVLDRVNPYEARYTDFYNNESPATYSSQIQIAGGPFIGKVALNSDKNVIENVGLIQLYETVLARARELTLNNPGVANDGTNQAVLLAATRLATLYELLAREAYSDAQNPLVPVSTENGLGDAAPYIHAFQNQENGLMQEELALLRGTDFVKAYPSQNRLFWNYVKGTGEAAYNAVYSIQDSNTDGFINEFDAAEQYPQGHGDAWGHFLSANNMHYTLLGLSEFHWQARDELYALLDNVIETDYLDEKSFARIAAAKARTGVEIVRATYRDAYVANPEGQWQGYTDTASPARAWGVSEWAKRSGQAAYFDWMVGNAVVPNNGSATLEGLALIDRQTNIAELSEIASALHSIQTTLDDANSGANPAGLDADSIPFDIAPLEVSGAGDGSRKSHFEQIYERAVAAAQNAVTAHKYASVSERQLRKLTDDTFSLQVESVRQDIAYRNRLIEIFGTPYDGQIGAGKAYPEGYEGPDSLLYLYVDRTDPARLYPSAGSTRFTQVKTRIASAKSTYGNLDFNNFLFTTVPDFSESISQIYDNSFLTGTAPVDTITIPAPVRLSTSDYAFAVPDVNNDGTPDWGTRGSTGQVQVMINELLLEELALKQSLQNYKGFIEELDIRNQRLTALLEAQKIKNRSRVVAAKVAIGLNVANIVGQLQTSVGEYLNKYAILGGFAVSELFPTTVGLSNDVTSVGRGAALGIAFAGATGADTVAGIGTFLSKASEASLAFVDAQLNDTEVRAGEFMEIRGVIEDMASLVRKEEGMRIAIGSHVQRMQIKSAAIKSLTAEGFRIMNEREGFNTTLAAKAQRNRYSDMVSRLSRNESLTHYQSAYNNAVRYAWLAAKAYDYETSLDSGDPAAATTFFESIIKERQLGLWTSGQPQTGNGGLAATLAMMKANYDTLKSQLGINNPQLETGLLSLRHEHFRIAREAEVSSETWKKTLTQAKVSNLWDVPEFRKYCRPFASPADGAQPGIVIEFSTEINNGLNVFGRNLGANDHAYSSANFATKINSLGVWFESYNNAPLSTTPRVYLVPVGNDVLRVANSNFPTERSWNVVEQVIPTPFIINNSHLDSPNFIPGTQSLNGSFADIRRFGDFRAYHSDGSSSIDNSQLTTNSRLIGRSVANTRWMLIIPGATLHADANYGVQQFVDEVKDIKLQFETYSHEGN